MKRILLFMAICLLANCASFANLTQGHWRWHNNDGSESTASWKADENTAISITDYKAIRLRVNIFNNTGDPKNLNHELKYATSQQGPWYTISDVSAMNPFVLGGDNSFISHGEPTTMQMPGSEETFKPGLILTRQDNQTDTLLNETSREYEWCIKPTANIRPATTYYFKSNAGDTQFPLPSLTTGSENFTPAEAAVLPNGGFENLLSSWTTATENASAATFDITQDANTFHAGLQSLAVNVTNHGPANSVSLSSNSIQLQDTGAYLLRFWAFADQRNALLDVELNNGGAQQKFCHYQIYDRFKKEENGWQMYQYAFKVNQGEGPLTLKMNFNSNATYYLDDIEIINQHTHPNIDVESQYVWQNNFKESYGWLSGDNNNPVLLPDSSVAWVYNDSFMGDIDPNSNVISSNRILNNLVVKRSGDSLTTIYKGTAPNSQNLFSPGNGNIFWQSGGIIENNSLKVLLIEISGGNYAGRSWVGTLSLPDLQPIGLRQLPATIDVSPNCIMTDGAYNYIYFGQSSGSLEMHTIMARVPVGQFDSDTPWEYYQADESWSTDYTNAKHIVNGVAAGNVMKLSDNNYVMSGVPNLSTEIDAWFAPTPYGPWGNKTVIYNTPVQEDILAYEGHLDPINRDGYYTFTYSVYPFVTEEDGSNGSVTMQKAVKSTYIPIYARANLMELSPYSGKKPADSLFSFTGNIENEAVILNWTSALATDDHYEVQRSTDGLSWDMVTTVNGADSVTLSSYVATDPSPVRGLNYYRLALYNMDHQLHYSDVLQVDNAETLPVGLISFTARAEGKTPGKNRVKLSWVTASGSDMGEPRFTVERSGDNQSFVPLGQISDGHMDGSNAVSNGESRGTGELHYSYYDASPLNGLNYYRLRYQSGNQEKISGIRSVDFNGSAAPGLLITPNPAQGRIRFVLKGYTGNRFEVSLTDMAGRILEQKSITVNGSGQYQLQTRPKTGLYLLKVSGEGLSQAAKVLVK